MLLPLTFAGHPILNKKTKEIPLKELSSAKVQTFLDNLGETIKHYKWAAGLAAPQVNKDWKVFGLQLDKGSMNYEVLSPKNFKIPENEPFFYINPKIEFIGTATDTMGEGCLSIPFYHVFVERYLSIKLTAFTRDGKKFEIVAKGIFARYLQHEYDHLNGITLFQRAKHSDDIVFDAEQLENWRA